MRIALIPDCKNWAWWYMAQDIAEFAPAGCEVHVTLSSDLSVEQTKQYDGVLQMSWFEAGFGLPTRNVGLVASEGCMYEPSKVHWPAVIATRLRNRKTADERLPKFDGLLCNSSRLRSWCATQLDLCSKVRYKTVGVNVDLFQPKADIGRRRKLTIGWCGQCSETVSNAKGYRWLLKRVQRLCGERYEWRINARNAKDALSRTEMADWYQGIDVMLCTSITEGMPMPIIEAMACGRPVISTDVGDVKHVVGATGWTVESYQNDRTASICADKMMRLLNRLDADRKTLALLGRRARKRAEQLDWRKQSREWVNFIGGEYGLDGD